MWAQDYKSNLEMREVELMAKITRDMTIAQILTMDMETAKIFMESGMHCVGCPSSSGESLEQACAVHGLEIDPLMKKLNEHFATEEDVMKKYECTVCGYVYDPAEGDPDNGVAAGTAWEAVPGEWVCPLCGADKDMFEAV